MPKKYENRYKAASVQLKIALVILISAYCSVLFAQTPGKSVPPPPTGNPAARSSLRFVPTVASGAQYSQIAPKLLAKLPLTPIRAQ